MTSEKSMLLVTSQRAGSRSFRMMPLTNECPFIEVVYDPMSKVLVVFHKHQVEGLHMIPKLDDNGDAIRHPKQTKENPYKQERKVLATAHESYLIDREEIIKFVELMAFNPEYDFKAHLNTSPLIQPEKPTIITP